MVTLTDAPAGEEVRFGLEDIIVSKTDAKGRITYVNRVFLDVSGYTRNELLGQPHSIIRHPDMPAGVFKLLWDTIQGGHEIFAYVKNSAKVAASTGCSPTSRRRSMPRGASSATTRTGAARTGRPSPA